MSSESPIEGRDTLAGKVALVTGGAKRVGAAIAHALHAAGANVVLHYRTSASEADALAAELEGRRAHSVTTVMGDLLDTGRLPAVVESATRAFGRLDILINNASTFYATPLAQIDEEQWDDLIGSNLKAPLFLAQAAAAPLTLARGLILNIVDIHGLRPLRRHPIYSIAKAGLIMATRSLARELGPHVRVNGIAPGPVMWPDSGADEARKRKIVERTLLQRTGSPQDVAAAALFFATNAPYVTGQILAVDGGRSVGW